MIVDCIPGRTRKGNHRLRPLICLFRLRKTERRIYKIFYRLVLNLKSLGYRNRPLMNRGALQTHQILVVCIIFILVFIDI